ncbi:MAG: helix-turn-helix transcriptional regulator [candidate division NC10 bacterium]|nr:helix-turn-helix transcriptional regulator [candidate division NC10 bacterium]
MRDHILELKANILKALGQPTRLKILELLRNGERCVCEIFPAIQEEQSNVSRHLALMKAAGILASRKQGQMVHYRVRDPQVFKLLDGVTALLKTHMEDRKTLSRRLT